MAHASDTMIKQVDLCSYFFSPRVSKVKVKGTGSLAPSLLEAVTVMLCSESRETPLISGNSSVPPTATGVPSSDVVMLVSPVVGGYSQKTVISAVIVVAQSVVVTLNCGLSGGAGVAA